MRKQLGNRMEEAGSWLAPQCYRMGQACLIALLPLHPTPWLFTKGRSGGVSLFQGFDYIQD